VGGRDGCGVGNFEGRAVGFIVGLLEGDGLRRKVWVCVVCVRLESAWFVSERVHVMYSVK